MSDIINVLTEDRCIVNIIFNTPTIFTRSDFLSKLDENKFETTSGKEIKEGPLQVTIESAHVGKKADVNIFHDPVKGVIGIVSKKIESTFNVFNEIVEILRKDLTLDLNTTVKYYEIIYILFLSSTKPPWEVVKTYVGSEKVGGIGAIMGRDIGVSTINFCNYKGIPTDEKWYSLSIEPAIKNPEQYCVKITFRSPDISEIKKHSKELQKEIIEVVKSIEENV